MFWHCSFPFFLHFLSSPVPSVFLSFGSCCCLLSVKTELMSTNSAVLRLSGNSGLWLCPEGAAKAKTETLQQTDPCSCLSYSGMCPPEKKKTETEAENSSSKEQQAYSELSLHSQKTFVDVLVLNVSCPSSLVVFLSLQTSWRCFAVENFESATFRMFLSRRSNVPTSTLSTPKSKKSVCIHCFHLLIMIVVYSRTHIDRSGQWPLLEARSLSLPGLYGICTFSSGPLSKNMQIKDQDQVNRTILAYDQQV